MAPKAAKAKAKATAAKGKAQRGAASPKGSAKSPKAAAKKAPEKHKKTQEKSKDADAEKAEEKEKSKKRQNSEPLKPAAKLVIPPGHDVKQVQKAVNLFEQETWRSLDESVNAMDAAEREKKRQRLAAKAAAEAADGIKYSGSVVTTGVVALLGMEAPSKSEPPPALAPEEGAGQRQEAAGENGTPAHDATPCVACSQEAQQSEAMVVQELVEGGAKGVEGGNHARAGHAASETPCTDADEPKRVSSAAAVVEVRDMGEGEKAVAGVNADGTISIGPQVADSSLFQAERERNMGELKRLFAWPLDALCMAAASSVESQGDDQAPFMQHMVEIMQECTISTSFSGIDTPATAFAQLLLGARRLQGKLPSESDLESMRKHNLFGVEWSTAAQHDLLRHPFGPVCLFSDMTELYSDSLSHKLNVLVKSRRLIDVVLNIIESGDSAKNLRSCCYCLRHDAKCSALGTAFEGLC